MPSHYELRRRERLDQAFRRIATEQLDRAAAHLLQPGLADVKRVHETRKRFKESRALARLFRFVLSDEFRFHDRWYRDAGRKLSAYRDAAATVEAVEKLPDEVRSDIGRRMMGRLLNAVRRRRDERYADRDALRATVASVLAMFPEMRLRIAGSELSGWRGGVERGFARILRQAHSATHEAFASGDDLAFHEWRKRVKDHWYHVRLFAPAWSQLFGALETALDELSQLLGDHHDLVVVRAASRAAQDELGGEAGVDRIAGILAARQRALVEEAKRIASRVFVARPEDRAREVLTLWEEWHGAGR